MPHIVLTEEQARILSQANGPVDVRDEQGRPVASLTLLTPADLESIEQSKRALAAGRPSISSEQRRAHFQRLKEIGQSEGLDEAKMLELLRRMRSGEEV